MLSEDWVHGSWIEGLRSNRETEEGAMGEESPTSQVRKRCFGLRMEKEKGSSLEFELFADHHLSTDSSNKSPFLLQFIQELKAICQPQTVWQSQNPRPGSLSISKHLT